MWRIGHLYTHTAGKCVNCYKASRRQSVYTNFKKKKKVKQNAPRGLLKQIMLYPYNAIAYYVAINTMVF